MLMMAALTILSISVFAQEKAGKKDTARHATFSSSLTDTKNLALSGKEQMKMEVIKISQASIGVNVANKDQEVCPSCLAFSRLSPKEKMKAQVVGIYKCSTYYDSTGTVKCRLCGMCMTSKNS